MTESDRMRELAVSLPGSSVHPSPSSADVEGLVCAVVYVGDQLARVVAALESVRTDDMSIAADASMNTIGRRPPKRKSWIDD